MSAFAAIDTSRTGLGFSQYWLETISHNVANINTVTSPDQEPFRQRYVVAQPNTDEFSPSGSGVHVAGLLEDATEAALTESPGHPLADENGRVQMPVVDLAGQLTDLMVAQRSFQANSRAIHSAREAYASALRIGNA
jgi:flagellar basal-body rod protein FlgC